MSELKFEVVQTAGVINANFEEYEQQIKAEVSEYEGALFTEDSKAFGKKVIAEMRKKRASVVEATRQVKTEWLKPYDEFKVQVDGLLQYVDKHINDIDSQLKEMEAVRVAKRKADIQALYDSVIGEMLEYLPLEKIYDSKWENASVKLPAVKKAMIEVIGKSYEEVTTIKNMDSEAVPKALEMYKRDLSLANAVKYINNYESQRLEILRREEEKKRDLEIERIRREERDRVAQEQQIREETRRETVDELKSVDESLAGVWPVAPEAKKVIYT
ncbi:DUF1351 domain-containing protein, partial [Hungatella sp. SL.1.14]|uniref:DUF1351 domain-containing protein n=1 Tax=Hungatella sp. SL.1.14 TaxID=2963703 RepID=UPI00210B6966